MKKIIYQFFELKKLKTNIKTEVFAGIATFLAMAYILTVNPNTVLWDGTADPRYGLIFTATALRSEERRLGQECSLTFRCAAS